MAVPARDEGRVSRMVDREPDSIKIARIEEAVGGIRNDLSEIKASLGNFDHRLTYIEDVRVRALEDRETRRRAVDQERARADGMPAAVVVESVLNVLAAASPVVAFNARFDLTILDREARRYGLQPLSERGPLYVVDPYVIDKHLDRYRRGSRKLDAICTHYGAELDKAHDAGADAIAAARCAWVLAKRGQIQRRARDTHEARELLELRNEWERVRLDLPALHEAQVRWAAEQARSLAAYFAEKGEPQHVEPEWPIVHWPFEEAA